MKPAVERVVQALRQQGIEPAIADFSESTRSAEDAARAVGTEVACIVKSLVFLADGNPLLTLVSGSNRVSLSRLGAALSATISRADAATVRAVTGFAIGGVPPVGLATSIPVVCDTDLLRWPLVFAAAGTPNAVFSIVPDVLVRITSARVVDLKEDPPAPAQDQRGASG